MLTVLYWIAACYLTLYALVGIIWWACLRRATKKNARPHR